MVSPFDPPHEKFVLLYMPRCNSWYVHSHKLYSSFDEAREAAEKFLPVGTPIAIAPLAAVILKRELVR
jgi:hypothetical protein